MDDAGDGRRGLRAAPTAAVLGALREQYGIEASEPRDLGGSSSLNLLVADGPIRWVVRVYRPSVTPGRLAAVNLVRRALARGGVPVSQPLPTQESRDWAAVDGRLLEVERYVEHDAIMDSWSRLEAGLPLLGRIHALLGAVAVAAEGRSPRFANYVEPAHARAATARGTARIRSWGPTPAEERLARRADELAELVSAGERELVAATPRQLVHGDFWHNNVLFRGGRVALVADFDFMGERARIDDLALVLYFAATGWGHHAADERLRARLRRLVDAYDRGLDRPLAAPERAALPWALARQPLWGIGGWVAALDDPVAARRHAAGMAADVAWALRVVRMIGRWQRAFA